MIWQNSGPAFPLFLEALLYLGYLLLTLGFNPFNKDYFATSTDEIGEELPPYFDHLSDTDIKWSQKEKHEYGKRFGLHLAAIENKDYYQRSDRYKLQYKAFLHHISGVHTYDMLRNPVYSAGFQYIPYSLPVVNGKMLKRALFNLDGDTGDDNNECQSDLVRIAMFLPFYSPEI